MRKILVFIFVIFFILGLGLEGVTHNFVYGLNRNDANNIHHCIHNDEQKIQRNFQTWDGDTFKVSYVEESKNVPACINPRFPSIHIEGTTHSAWIQFIFTDFQSQARNQWNFIDTTSEQKIFPFYTYERDFYDSPLWQAGFFFKPLSYWRAHVYAIKHAEHTICPIAGIEWGFKMKKASLKVEIIKPVVLNKTDFKLDFAKFNSELQDYKIECN